MGSKTRLSGEYCIRSLKQPIIYLVEFEEKTRLTGMVNDRLMKYELHSPDPSPEYGAQAMAARTLGWTDMTTLGSDRWQLKAWAGHARALALVFWAAAVLMTGVMGWSAWRAVDTATDSVDRIVARHEAGIVAKSRDIFITRR